MRPNLNWLAAILRIEIRSLRRSAKRTILIGALIGLSVAAIVFISNLLFVTEKTPGERAASVVGNADLRIDSFYGREEIKQQLPQGSVLEPISFGNEDVLARDELRKVHSARINFDGLAQGIAKIVAGRAPKSNSEIAVTPQLLENCEKKIGDSIKLSVGGTVSVVGVAEFHESLNKAAVFYAYVPDANWGRTEWLVDLPQAFVDSQEEIDTVLFDSCTTRSKLLLPRESDITIVFLFGSFGFALAALIIAAAFIVGIRRRQREMGLLAASGGSPFHILTSVVMSACVIAIVAGTVGALFGLVGAGIMHPWLDSINGRRNGPFEVSWLTHIVTISVGVITGVMSSVIPALAASRMPVKQALSSRRPAPKNSSRWAWVGCAMVLIGVVLVGSAPMMLKESGGGSADNNSMLAILVGSIMGIVGFGLCSPLLLSLVAKVAVWLPLSWRLAVRETGRFRTRNGPIVTAILAGLSLSVMLGTIYQSVRSFESSAAPKMRDDQLLVSGPESGFASQAIIQEFEYVLISKIEVATLNDQPLIAGHSEELNSTQIAIANDSLLTTLGFDEVDGALVRQLNLGNIVALENWEDQSVRVLDPNSHKVLVELPVTNLTEMIVEEGAPVESMNSISPIGFIVSASTARRNGWSLQNGLNEQDHETYLIRMPEQITQSTYDLAGVLVNQFPGTTLRATINNQESDSLLWSLLIASIALGLSIIAIATALAAEEAKCDQRILTTVGASPAVYRHQASARSGLLALIGGWLSIPAGVLPAFGIISLIPSLEFSFPWIEAVALGFGLPVVAYFATWAILLIRKPRPISELKPTVA